MRQRGRSARLIYCAAECGGLSSGLVGRQGFDRAGYPSAHDPSFTVSPRASMRRRFNDGAGDVVRTGHGAGCLIDSEVIEGEPTLDGRAHRPWFDQRSMSGASESGEHFPGTVGRVGKDLDAGAGDRGIQGESRAPTVPSLFFGPGRPCGRYVTARRSRPSPRPVPRLDRRRVQAASTHHQLCHPRSLDGRRPAAPARGGERRNKPVLGILVLPVDVRFAGARVVIPRGMGAQQFLPVRDIGQSVGSPRSAA